MKTEGILLYSNIALAYVDDVFSAINIDLNNGNYSLAIEAILITCKVSGLVNNDTKTLYEVR